MTYDIIKIAIREEMKKKLTVNDLNCTFSKNNLRIFMDVQNEIKEDVIQLFIYFLYNKLFHLTVK